MGGRGTFRGGARLARRGIALALVLTTAWIISRTADPPGLDRLLGSLSQDTDLVVSILAAQLGDPGDREDGLDGWGKLLLRQSALLSGGEEAVQALREREQAAPAPPEPPGEGQPEPELQPLPGGEVVEHTSLGRDDGSYLSSQEVYVKNTTAQSVDVAALAAQNVDLGLGEGLQILIYHTHGSEGYTQTENERYVESDAYRTTDCTHNVVRVGEEMAEVFRSMGFQVVHDTTLYDYPVYNTAYDRARAGVSKKLEQHPTVKFVLDVHRDAIVSEDGAAYKLIAQEGEEKVAQVMLVVGSSDSGAAHPNWRANLALAVRLQLALTGRYDQLARPIVLRGTRFNQDLAPGALLVEVGGHGNTLEEAIAGGRLFAQTAGELLKSMEQ